MSNEDWLYAVHRLLRSGYGVEDIAVKLTKHKMKTSPAMVRKEVRRLRESGNLMRVLDVARKGKWNDIRKDECGGDH